MKVFKAERNYVVTSRFTRHKAAINLKPGGTDENHIHTNQPALGRCKRYLHGHWKHFFPVTQTPISPAREYRVFHSCWNKAAAS